MKTWQSDGLTILSPDDFGGACSNFNDSAYKTWENKIAKHLENGDNVGPIKVNFGRKDPSSARPDSLTVEYTINGVTKKIPFRNQHGG